MLCKACLSEKSASEFYKSNRTRCMECIKTSVRANRAARIDYYRSYDKARASAPHRVAARAEYQSTPAGRIAVARAHATYKVRHAERRNAQVLVGNAVRDGRLRQYPCWVCGEKAEAHHPDYSRPLDVVWLCQPHHKQAHALVANDTQMKESA